MNTLFQKLSTFFHKLDDANGEKEITSIMQEWNSWLSGLPQKEKEIANAEFSYYITKRFVKAEEKVQQVSAEISRTI